MSIYLGYILGSALLDIIANVMLEMSNGFRNKRWGVGAVVFIMAAFALLALAVTGINLFIAYAVWGAISIIGIAIATRILFKHQLNWVSWLGLFILIAAIMLMHSAGSH